MPVDVLRHLHVLFDVALCLLKLSNIQCATALTLILNTQHAISLQKEFGP